MNYLIDYQAQSLIADQIDKAVAEVLVELSNHGGEEGLTSALGSALMKQSFKSNELRVVFNYRQLSKYTEEHRTGADGGFLVRVATADGVVQKAALFQAKLLPGDIDVRNLTMRRNDAQRLQDQVVKMLRITDQSVALFYTERQIYVVNAADYGIGSRNAALRPLSKEHRLITLGTYLGSWLPRCTKGDQDPGLNARIEHLNGFKAGISMDVVSTGKSIAWKEDLVEARWDKSR